MLSGEEFDAAEAYRIGLVHDICEEPDLNGTVGRLLANLYTSGPNAIVAVKKLIPEVAAARFDDALVEMTAERIAQVRTTAEAQEGLTAFLEKRKAAWVTPVSEKAKGKADAKKGKARDK
jgi:methylglutaconyl-CoA hydratase